MKTQQINNELLALNNLILVYERLYGIHKIDVETYEKNLNTIYDKTLELMKMNKED